MQQAFAPRCVSAADYLEPVDAARRRGYFLAGVGLKTGHALDAIAPDANHLLIQANAAHRW